MLTFNSNTPFSSWFREYIEVYKKPTVQPGSIKDIESIISLYFMPYLENMKLQDIRLINLQQCINEMAGKSNAYINRAYIYIKEIFQKAVENDLLVKSPALNLTKPKGKSSNRRALTEDERKMFIAELPTHQYGALFGIMLACGLRPAEARALTLFDLDLKNKQICVSHAIERHSLNVKEPKTKAGFRTIPIPDWYIPYLENIKKTSQFVFTNRLNNMVGRKTID